MTGTNTPTLAVPVRSQPDVVVRRLLRIPDERPAKVPDIHAAFSRSILVSAARCLLTYVVLPFLAPVLGIAAGVGPWIGIPLGLVAVAFNVASIRRFFLAEHRLRWHYAVIGLTVISLLFVLVGTDAARLVR